jgi:ATP-dependent Clp protease ATP-binding subunit ClpA
VFERFTSQARWAVIHAQDEARRLRHPRIGSEHVLVGLLAEPTGAGGRALRRLDLDLEDAREEFARRFETPPTRFAAAETEALRSLGIDLDEVRRTVEETFGPGALERAEHQWIASGHIPFAPDAKKTLELSLREALRLRAKHIGTEHIVLGLLRLDERSGASRILEARGVVPERLRVEIELEIERGGDRPERTA